MTLNNDLIATSEADLIDRQYAIEQIKKARDKGYTFNYDTLIDFIEVLPSAERRDKCLH